MTPDKKSEQPFDKGYYRAYKLIKDARTKWDQEALESGDADAYWMAFFLYLQEIAAESVFM